MTVICGKKASVHVEATQLRLMTKQEQHNFM
jgi:hypothetical protein